VCLTLYANTAASWVKYQFDSIYFLKFSFYTASLVGAKSDNSKQL